MFSQKWDIPHPYRVSLYDSFYSKLNEGSLMGEGRGNMVPAPFFQVKENPPRDDLYSEGGGLVLKCSDGSGSAAHAPEVGKGVEGWAWGWVPGWHNYARETSLSPESPIRGEARDQRQQVPHLVHWRVTKGPLFLRCLQMTWDMTSPWLSEASGAPEDRGWQAVAWSEW